MTIGPEGVRPALGKAFNRSKTEIARCVTGSALMARFSHDGKHLGRCRQFILRDISIVHVRASQSVSTEAANPAYSVALTAFVFPQHSFHTTRKANSEP